MLVVMRVAALMQKRCRYVCALNSVTLVEVWMSWILRTDKVCGSGSGLGSGPGLSLEGFTAVQVTMNALKLQQFECACRSESNWHRSPFWAVSGSKAPP